MYTIKAVADFTPEDIAVLVRACERGTFRTVAAMVMDGGSDDYVMQSRTCARALDAEYDRECAERDAADRADWRAMNGIDDDVPYGWDAADDCYSR